MTIDNINECAGADALRNKRGERILTQNHQGEPALRLTRTLYLPVRVITGIRRAIDGEGTEILTNSGMQRVFETFEDVMAAYEAARVAEGGAK